MSEIVWLEKVDIDQRFWSEVQGGSYKKGGVAELQTDGGCQAVGIHTL